MKWTHTVGSILADNWKLVRGNNLNGHQLKHLNLMSRCHTASLGGTVNECQKCSEISYTYHSCRNRHCPSCGGSKREQWIERQQSYLMDTSCIVPGGGVTKHGKWKYSRSKGKYLFPVKAMAAVYKGIFMAELKRLAKIGAIELPPELRESLYKKQWVVYAKRPFAKPDHVIEYLGRYTHKVAISNHRLLQYDSEYVLFNWKDYRKGAKVGVMELETSEFIRRLSMHILPHKFVRIRHYGLLSFHARSKTIPLIQAKQNYIPRISPVYILPARILQCHKCKSQKIVSTPLHPTKTRSP